MSTFTAKDLCAAQDVVLLRADMTVEEGLHCLTKAGVLSAPICDADGKWVGLVDHLDILFWAMQVSTAPVHSKTSPISTDVTRDDVGMVMQRMHEFSFAQLDHGITNLSQLNPFRTIAADAAVAAVLELFGDGCHRAVVLDAEGKPAHILTQSRVLEHLNAYPDRFGSAGNKTLEELGLLSNVISCKAAEKAVTAFRRMMGHRVSAVAVTDDSGKLVANLSATDIKLVRQFQYDALLDSVEKYLRAGREFGGNLVACTADCTLADAVRQMVEAHVHRVYVVDANMHAVGIVTLSDVARLLAASQ